MDRKAEYPLADVRVLDLSRVVSGPFAGRLLADLGADVVKIEPPGGDMTRIHGRKTAGMTGFFHQQNAGKRNICVDLQAPGAADLVKDLARVADIVIENYRPGVMQRLGIDYPELKQVNNRLIMLSITGFGQEGPEVDKPSYAPVVHAEVGLMHRLAQRNQTPPGDLPLSVADTNASLHGLVAVLAALHLRDRTGVGQHIDMSMMDATFATDDRSHFELDDVPDTIVVGPIVELPFGPVFIAADPEMKLVFKRLLRNGLIEDPTPEDADIAHKIEARRAVIDDKLQSCQTLEQFSALMGVLDIPWGEVRDPHNLPAQPTLAYRNMLVDVDDRAGGTRPLVNSPYRFSDALAGIRGPASHKGEHNQAVLLDWLNYSEAEVQQLAVNGIVVSSDGENTKE